MSYCDRPACVNIFTWTTSLKPLIEFWPNFTGMIPGWSPIKVVQTVPVGCISRSLGQKIVFQNAIFKNLVWKYKAQSLHIWYRASSDTQGWFRSLYRPLGQLARKALNLLPKINTKRYNVQSNQITALISKLLSLVILLIGKWWFNKLSQGSM